MKSSGSFNGGGDTVDEQDSSLASHCFSKLDTRESKHRNNKSRNVKKAMVCDAAAAAKAKDNKYNIFGIVSGNYIAQVREVTVGHFLHAYELAPSSHMEG